MTDTMTAEQAYISAKAKKIPTGPRVMIAAMCKADRAWKVSPATRSRWDEYEMVKADHAEQAVIYSSIAYPKGTEFEVVEMDAHDLP